MSERQVPFFCPYCGEETLRPSGQMTSSPAEEQALPRARTIMKPARQSTAVTASPPASSRHGHGLWSPGRPTGRAVPATRPRDRGGGRRGPA